MALRGLGILGFRVWVWRLLQGFSCIWSTWGLMGLTGLRVQGSQGKVVDSRLRVCTWNKQCVQCLVSGLPCVCRVSEPAREGWCHIAARQAVALLHAISQKPHPCPSPLKSQASALPKPQTPQTNSYFDQSFNPKP